MSDPNAPAGWYPDVYDETRQRYWDGTEWTEHYHPVQTAAGESPVTPATGLSGGRLAAVVSVVAVVLVGALITTIVLVNRENNRRAAVESFCAAYSLDGAVFADAQSVLDSADVFVDDIVSTNTISLSDRDSLVSQLTGSASRVQTLFFSADHEFIPFEQELSDLTDELTEAAEIIQGFDVGQNTLAMQESWDFRTSWVDPQYIEPEATQLCGWDGE